MVRDQMFTLIVLDQQIIMYIVRIWDVDANWNKPWNYIFNQSEEKEGFWKIGWETLTSPIVSENVTEPIITAKILWLC